MNLDRRTFLAGTAAAAAGLATPIAFSNRAAAGPAAGRGAARTIGFDRYSLLVDGVRTPIWSGEFHPMRLPSPRLWPDVLQKMRANGFNAVSMYFSWNYHSPAPGSYDFTGVRDMGRALRDASDAGLYVIARSGPYVNGELDAGGFPAWLAATAGTARSDDPEYLRHVDEWQHEINTVIAAHQYPTGDGTVILYQIENEYAAHVSDQTGAAYLGHLYRRARQDGIVVPVFHNDKGRNGYWTPGSFPGSGDGSYLYAFDGYPGWNGTPPDWGYFGTGGPKGGATASPDTPGFLAEFGGGWFDPWGGAVNDGRGYQQVRDQRDARYERAFYLTNLANGIKLHNVYMAFGGTSWGWLPAPVVYTSYDYGAALTEARGQTAKLTGMKQLGGLLAAVPDLAELDPADDAPADDPSVKVYHLANPHTGAHLYVARAATGRAASFTLPVDDGSGTRTVPASGSLRLAAGDAAALVSNVALGGVRLVYSTAQVMAHAPLGGRDLLVLTGRDGADTETVLRLSRAPEAGAGLHWDAAAGELRINRALPATADPAQVAVRAGDRSVLVLLAGDTAAGVLWPRQTPAGAVLVHGPRLLRTAEVAGSRLELTGDTAEAAALTVWAPPQVRSLTWNGKAVPARRTAGGALAAIRPLPGAPAVHLPPLDGWQYAEENPEADPGFDDSAWTAADRTTSHSTTAVPDGQPVLFADDYGFHHGDVWYRGRFTGDPGESVDLAYQTGTAGTLLAWLDGTPLGAHRMPAPTKDQATQGTWAATAHLAVGQGTRTGGAHLLSVLVRPMAHDEDGGANDAFKAARGLTAATLASGAPLAWRIQGATAPDRTRGPLNNGGLYGERQGWHLPGRPRTGTWRPVALPHLTTRQGVTWYRTAFTLDLPADADASLGVTLDDPTFGTADPAPYRVLLFCNGWNMGQYANDLGPQTTFVLPTGVLDPAGRNTLALAVTATGTAPAGPPRLTLADLGTVRGGVPAR